MHSSTYVQIIAAAVAVGAQDPSERLSELLSDIPETTSLSTTSTAAIPIVTKFAGLSPDCPAGYLTCSDSTLGWTSTQDLLGSSYWAPITYSTIYTYYFSSRQFFEECTTRYDDLNASPLPGTGCAPTYTECSTGWIKGPSASSKCETTSSNTVYRCQTDLYYTTYGSNEPLSRVQCKADSQPLTIFGEEPSAIPPPAGATETSTCDSHGRPCLDSSEWDKTPVIVGVVVGVVGLAAIIGTIFYCRRRRQRHRQREAVNPVPMPDDPSDSLAMPTYPPPAVVSEPERNECESSKYKDPPPPYKP